MTGEVPTVVPPARRRRRRHPIRLLLAALRDVETRAQTEQGRQDIAWWTVYLKGPSE